MVTSLKASEKNVGYRGSKSVISKNIAVKEQRVNGSWCGIKSLLASRQHKFAFGISLAYASGSISCPHLRCTLMDFERNYHVKILSNQINQKRSYSIGINNNTNLSLNLDLFQDLQMLSWRMFSCYNS